MSGATIGWTILGIVVIAAVIVLVFYILSWLYRRSTKEVSFVRTGAGGQKVVIGGGALVLPVIHDVIPVNMNTLRLEVRRGRESALITRNRMRVDVVAEFYVRVKATHEAVADAAQTLGSRTMQPDQLRELIEGKFVDALRSVAAEMSMEEMHEKRGEYVKRVRAAVANEMMLNGLELEAVSLTGLDQTNMEYFNPSNAFDAEGLTQLTEEIERRKKIRNDIEQDTMIQIRNKNLESEKLALDIDRESEYARLAQERELEVRRAQQRAALATERAQRERESEEARIAATREVELAKIAQERSLEQQRIARERDIQALEIERRQTIEIAEQSRAIAVAEKSREQSEAQAEADLARAQAVAAEEKVFSARELEVARRRKEIELIGAAQEVERETIRLQKMAEAEKIAAGDRGAARRMAAEAEADADKIRSLAAKLRYEIDAIGTRQMNEAQNILTPEARQSALRIRIVEKLDDIIRESVKPMEKIEGIKIFQVDGLGGGNGGRGDSGNGGIADNVVNSALRYRAQAPLIDAMLREIGLQGGDIDQLASSLTDMSKAPVAEKG
jgi:uncharacterized membrane protein YqiK